MKTTYHQRIGDQRPKRGDLIQSNVGDRRERTWIVLRVRAVSHRHSEEMGGIIAQRTKVWAEKWWEVEPELRMRFFRSAERNGGQIVFPFYRFKPKQKSKPRPWQWSV